MSSTNEIPLHCAKLQCVRLEESAIPVATAETPAAAFTNFFSSSGGRDVLIHVAFQAFPNDPQVKFVCKAWDKYLSTPAIAKRFDGFTKWAISVYTFVDIRNCYTLQKCTKCQSALSPWVDIASWKERYKWPGRLPDGVPMPSVNSTQLFRLYRYLEKRNMLYLVTAEHFKALIEWLHNKQGPTLYCNCPEDRQSPAFRTRVINQYVESLIPHAGSLRGTWTLPVESAGVILQISFRPRVNPYWCRETMHVDVDSLLIRTHTRGNPARVVRQTPYSQETVNQLFTTHTTYQSIRFPRRVTTLLEYVAHIILDMVVYRYGLVHHNVTIEDVIINPVAAFLTTMTDKELKESIIKFELGPYKNL
jgi:hypothetical protein